MCCGVLPHHGQRVRVEVRDEVRDEVMDQVRLVAGSLKFHFTFNEGFRTRNCQEDVL